MRTRLGHYDIVAELGRGGMGVVYKGYEASLNRYVAIKVLADSLAHDEAIKERFLREARSMAALNDPHIIQIYFIGEDEGQTYFVMEFVEGESLGSMLKRDHRLTVEQAAKVIQQTAMGLATAHDRGVIHRDIKPGNLMITSRGAVKIADFGIALSNQDLSKKLTSTGEFVGTPGYLSPEVCLGKPVDQRSDIFSLGIVLFEMLTGKMPFNDESPLGLMLEVVKAQIPDVREINHDADPQIARILARMIAKEPAERYQNCHELVTDLNTHPLVAKGGPITVQTRLSPAAATMIGQKTPVSGQASLPQTPQTPMRNVAAQANTRITPTGQPLPPPMQGGHQAVLDRPTSVSGQAPRSSALPWAIAALLLLGVAGGSYAMRDRIPVLANLFGTPAPTVVATATTPTSTATVGATDAVGANPPPAPPSATSVAASTAADAPATDASTTPASATTDAADPPAPPSEAVASTTDAGADAGAPAARASQAGMEALHDLPVAKAAEDAAQAPGPRVAKVTPTDTPATPPRPRVPTIAVVSSGDDVISSPAEDALVGMLQSRGFRVIEGGRGRGDSPNLRALAGKADAVVFVHARPVGTQQMNYYGQSSTLYTVQLGVRAYRVSDGSVLWRSSGEQVNFTSLNAAEKAREAIEPLLDAVDTQLAEFRSRGRRG
ncbi:serine/threonine-protein kinase [Dokdonella fugitiva]|uniref:non-specific serine/threonine protein kinase n=1 Tax=Dokdonella fugitiva TaxID=328517 RepID=A0A4R2IH22_9GAMM|nr:serine/threonine-protein kinase [Dokdonella fugitiva]TCO43129.1 serine/threonine-protein kinase [Dokdonella fugitiva]